MQDLAGEVPVVQRLGRIDSLITLQAYERQRERLGERLGESGLAGARLSLEQDRTLHGEGEVADRRETFVGEVVHRTQPLRERTGGSGYMIRHTTTLIPA